MTERLCGGRKSVREVGGLHMLPIPLPDSPELLGGGGPSRPGRVHRHLPGRGWLCGNPGDSAHPVLSPGLHSLAGSSLTGWLTHWPRREGAATSSATARHPRLHLGAAGLHREPCPCPQTGADSLLTYCGSCCASLAPPPPPRPVCPLTEAQRGRNTLKPDGAPTLPSPPPGKLHQKVLRASPPHRETYAVANEAGASGALKGDIQGLWTLLTARPPPPHHHLQALGLTQ